MKPTAVAVCLHSSEKGLVLRNNETGEICNSNEVGAYIWDLICIHKTAEEITLAVAAKYPNDDNPTHFVQVQKDIDKVVDKLLAAGLIEV